MACVARRGEITVGLGESRSVLRFNGLAEIREWLRRHRRDHVLERDIVVGRMSMAEAIEGTFQVAKFVGWIVATMKSLMLGR
jgi:hypothetical protein